MTKNQEFKNELIDKLTAERKHYEERMLQHKARLARHENKNEERSVKIAATCRDMIAYALGKIEKIDKIIADIESL